jgi:hypothetical protein
LQELSDHEIKRIFNECSAKEDEYRRLIRALQSVKRYTGKTFICKFIIDLSLKSLKL